MIEIAMKVTLLNETASTATHTVGTCNYPRLSVSHMVFHPGNTEAQTHVATGVPPGMDVSSLVGRAYTSYDGPTKVD